MMADHRIRVRVTLLAVHYLTECQACERLYSILIATRGVAIEISPPDCPHCGQPMAAHLETTHVETDAEAGSR